MVFRDLLRPGHSDLRSRLEVGRRFEALRREAEELERQADQIRRRLDAASLKEQAEVAERARQRWLQWERDQFLAREAADAEANQERRKAKAKATSGEASFPESHAHACARGNGLSTG